MVFYVIVSLSSCIISLFIAPFIISYLKGRHCKQYIHKNVPVSHVEKQGVPTIGGIIFLIPVMSISFFVIDSHDQIILLFLLIFGFAFIGFIDDILKIKCQRNLGLNMKQKLFLQVLVSASAFFIAIKELDSTISIPNTDYSFEMGWFYFFFFIFITIATVNATNLTDGLDGLLAGIVFIALIPYAIISYSLNKTELLLVILICMGSVLGFLFFNKYPAKIFMGDTGSFSLGGLLVGLSVITKTELLLVIIGAVLVMETLSVIIQITSLKIRKKRVFKMAPIHHTFELMGWNERRIVFTFWFLALIFACISIIIFLRW